MRFYTITGQLTVEGAMCAFTFTVPARSRGTAEYIVRQLLTGHTFVIYPEAS